VTLISSSWSGGMLERDMASPIRPHPSARPLLVALALLLAAAGCAGASGTAAPEPDPTAPTTATAPPVSTPAAEPDGEVVSGFVAFGDFGGGDAQHEVARAMERWVADGHRVDALVTTGDNVYDNGEPEKFRAQLDEPYRELRRSRPLWVTLGNHDVRAGHGAAQLRHLGLPDLPYAKELPGVQLLFVDANRPDQAQADWLEARLSAPGPRFRVAVFHQPAWSCSNHDSDEGVGRVWVPVFERHRVALVLNGHDHNYQRFVSDRGVTYVVTGGGGKGLYRLDRCPAGTPHRARGVFRNHFTAVEVRDRSLTLTAVAADGFVLDQAVIER
jgi:3',5'-cyclic AMP phosphodiesterase CpdA